MAKIVTRLCPQCNKMKPFREDQKTCGCPKQKITDKQTRTARVINVDATRICTEEQLIEALQIDLTKWMVTEFTVRKWEMGYVESEHSDTVKKDRVTTKKFVGKGKSRHSVARAAGGDETTDKDYTAGYEQLFAVACKLKRIATKDEAVDFISDNVKLLRQNKTYKLQLQAERAYREQLTGTFANYEAALEQITEIAKNLGDVKLQTTEIVHAAQPAQKLPINTDHTEDAVFMLSDLHFGDVIRPGDTSGFPEFDLPISGNRIGYIIEKVKQILTMHRAMYPIKKLYVWCGGDMGNGDLHDAPLSNSLFIGPQVDFTFKMCKFAIEDLLALTVPDPLTNIRVVEEVVLLFTCGNHMREATAKFMPLKYQSQRTFDWLIYQMLISWFKDTPRVTLREAMSPYIFENIRGHRHLFAHGMQVGYKNSPDTQAKSIDNFLKTVRSLFDSPEFRRKNGLEGATFARACIGDIHVPLSFPRFKSNGSLNGQNELGVNWGLEPIPAGQQLFGVTEKHLETFAYFVECTRIQKEPTDYNSYGNFALEYEQRFGRR